MLPPNLSSIYDQLRTDAEVITGSSVENPIDAADIIAVKRGESFETPLPAPILEGATITHSIATATATPDGVVYDRISYRGISTGSISLPLPEDDYEFELTFPSLVAKGKSSTYTSFMSAYEKHLQNSKKAPSSAEVTSRKQDPIVQPPSVPTKFKDIASAAGVSATEEEDHPLEDIPMEDIMDVLDEERLHDESSAPTIPVREPLPLRSLPICIQSEDDTMVLVDSDDVEVKIMPLSDHYQIDLEPGLEFELMVTRR